MMSLQKIFRRHTQSFAVSWSSVFAWARWFDAHGKNGSWRSRAARGTVWEIEEMVRRTWGAA